MRALLIALGAVMVVVGAIWTGQGLGYIGGSPMTDQTIWAILGPIVAGLGVGLLPEARPLADGVRLLTLRDPRIALRAYAVTRRGRSAWPPLAAVLRLLATPA